MEDMSQSNRIMDELFWKVTMDANTEEAYRKYLDTFPEGSHRDEAREFLGSLQKFDWRSVDKTSIDALQRFIEENPDDAHREEAFNILKELRREKIIGVGIEALAKQIKSIRTDTRINNPEQAIYDRIESFIKTEKIKVDELIMAIKEDNNFISGRVAYLLWENGIITDFSKAGIDNEFLAQMLSNEPPKKFQVPRQIDVITKSPCTEVYFWGIPSSGKSCAIGAILSCANSGRVAGCMEMDTECQGYGYMNRLANLFKTNGSIGILPEGTAISSTFEMGFDLEDEKGKVHPFTFIDLAGELVRCMYKKDAGDSLTEEQQDVLKTLTDILIDNRTGNRKIHFFVLEYGAEDREYEGLPQNVYLAAALAHIKKTGIFNKDTDGLYLLVTKVDKLHATGAELENRLREYITTNYDGFYKGLKKICRDNEINNGEVRIFPFTLGKVCFQNYCRFDDATAQEVIRKIMERSYVSPSNGLISKIFGSLRK